MPESKDFDEYLSAVASQLPESAGGEEYDFWKAPDLLEEIREGKLRLGLILRPSEIEEFRAILSGLIGLFIQRHLGDEKDPIWQLNLVHKFVFPRKFEINQKVVERLSKKYGSGHLIRGWALRRLMYELADLVELPEPDAEDVTMSPVFVSPGADTGHRLYPLVKRHCKRGTTLQSLAIRVYLELIKNENEDQTIDERSLRRDLRRLKAWEDADPEHTRLKEEYAAARAGHHWKARIPVRLYSESFRPLTPSELEEDALNPFNQPDEPKR